MKSKPDWLKKEWRLDDNALKVNSLIKRKELHTVCESARCPNRGFCYSQKKATFLLLGDICTRNCRFCNISSGSPDSLNPDEPQEISRAVKELELIYAVLTSTTRDDLDDGGASHYLETIAQIKQDNPDTLIEVLVPEFFYKRELYLKIAISGIAVFNHNIETARKVFYSVRDTRFDYDSSLNLLADVKKHYPDILTKSGFMVGVGEEYDDVIDTLHDLKNASVDIVTIGQYLQPSKRNIEVSRYVIPDEFKDYEKQAMKIGLKVFAGPFVRSSFNADITFKKAAKNGKFSSALSG